MRIDRSVKKHHRIVVESLFDVVKPQVFMTIRLQRAVGLKVAMHFKVVGLVEPYSY